MGRYDESIEAHKQAGAVHPNWGWGLGHTYALAGQREGKDCAHVLLFVSVSSSSAMLFKACGGVRRTDVI